VAKYYDDIEESEKIYFIGFLDNNKLCHKVSDRNLRKTRLLIGEDAYYTCMKHNISTRWSALPKDDNFNNRKALLKQLNT
jgi:hypothetical protein